MSLEKNHHGFDLRGLTLLEVECIRDALKTYSESIEGQTGRPHPVAFEIANRLDQSIPIVFHKP